MPLDTLVTGLSHIGIRMHDYDRSRAFYERLGGRREDVGNEYVGGAVVASVLYRWPNLKGWLAT